MTVLDIVESQSSEYNYSQWMSPFYDKIIAIIIKRKNNKIENVNNLNKVNENKIDNSARLLLNSHNIKTTSSWNNKKVKAGVLSVCPLIIGISIISSIAINMETKLKIAIPIGGIVLSGIMQHILYYKKEKIVWQ